MMALRDALSDFCKLIINQVILETEEMNLQIVKISNTEQVLFN